MIQREWSVDVDTSELVLCSNALTTTLPATFDIAIGNPPYSKVWRKCAKEAQGEAAQIANRLVHSDLVMLDELGDLPFSASGGALLFHFLSKLYERTSVIITTNLSFSEWAAVFGDAKMRGCG